MCYVPVYQALAVLEQAAAEEAFQEMLLASNVTDALEYAIMNDFCFGGNSLRRCAAVALVGPMRVAGCYGVRLCMLC